MSREIWWTSDLHFGHRNVAEQWRPFGDVDTMNEALIENWNATVGPDDEVNLLGDAVMGTFAENVHLLGRLNGRIRLTPGNHDRVHPAYGERRPHKLLEFTELYARYVTIAPLEWTRWGFHVCHFPYAGGETEWRDTIYPGYRVSNIGRVMAPGGRILKPWGVGDNRKYLAVTCGPDGKNATIHSLVCEAFHGPAPTPEHEVAHWDGNPINNDSTNLRWATKKENAADRKRHGTAAGGSMPGESNPRAILTAEKAQEIRESSASYTKIAEHYGVSKSTVADIKNGRSWIPSPPKSAPVVNDHTDEERYQEYRPVNDGKVLLHGHVHDLWKVNGRMVNVGVDVWDFRPVHLDEIRELCESEGL